MRGKLITFISLLHAYYYLQALSCEHEIVVLEAILGMELLTSKYGATLHYTLWERVLKILKRVAEFVSK